MKTTLCFTLILLTFVTLAFVPNSFAQDTRPVVRIIYFIPKDRTPQPDIAAKLDAQLKDVQQYYADQMESHGFGRKTFQIETDPNGKVVVHRVNGKFEGQHYLKDTHISVNEEVANGFELSENIYYIVVDNESVNNVCGVGHPYNHVHIAATEQCISGEWGHYVAAHELGHAFGLEHDFSGGSYLMSYSDLGSAGLSHCAAEWLSVHRAFNPDPTAVDVRATATMLQPNPASPPPAIRFRFEVTDPDGIHQVQLLTPTVYVKAALGFPEMLACVQGDGKTSSTIEFVATGLARNSKSVSLQVIDVNGHFWRSAPYSIDVAELLPPPVVVTVPDPHLAAALRTALNLDRNEPITQLSMQEGIRELTIPNRQITDLTGLEHAKKIVRLSLWENQIKDVTPLTNLIQLREIHLQANQISDIRALAGLTQLRQLHLWGNQIRDISALAGLTKLESLWLQNNQIRDVTALAELVNLRELRLVGNPIQDKKPLFELLRKNPDVKIYLEDGKDPLPVPQVNTTPTSLADIALIIDSSYSMRRNDPDNLRKSGAKLFITSADPKVQIAIVDFHESARRLASLTFADTTGKVALENAVDRVHSSGDDTNIDAGLQQGFQELNASTSSAKKAAVLLTDGQGRIEQDIIQKYAAKGWSIYTIGLGSGVDRTELERIAHATGGEYFWASQASHIQAVYNKILAKTTYQSVIASLTGYINKGQQIVKKVSIDGTLKQVYFGSDWQGSTIELVLIDPDGTQITPQDAAANPSITYQAAPTYAIYTIDNPKPGDWQMQATGTDIPAGGESFNLIVKATSDFLTNFLSLDSSYAVGDTIRIGIEIDERIGDTFAPVLGATTSAKIIRPDGKIDTLTLFDDGSHNDVAANDGKYANNYRAVDKLGTYLIKVSAENGFSREIQEQVVVGDSKNVFIDGSTLTPAAGATLKQTPNVISAVISGPAGGINANSIVLKVDGKTVTHTYNQVNQLVSYRPGGLSGGSHDVQLSLKDASGNTIDTTWEFTIESTTTAHPYIYWTERSTDKIQRANLDGSNIKDLITSVDGLIHPNRIALDVAGGKMYWTIDGRRGATGKIQRANFDGTNIETLVTGLHYPIGIALDVSGDKMYWTEWTSAKIRCANLDGSNMKDLVTHTDGLSEPQGIALDVSGGKLYWTDMLTNKIQRANLDGTSVQDLVTGLGLPVGIVLDVSDGKMYWTEWAAAIIRCANLDGSNIKGLVTHIDGLSEPQDIALDVSDGKMYWIDKGTGKIQRANLDGTNIEDLVTTGLESPLGIALAIGPADTSIPPVVREDINGDGVVDLQDIKVIAANLGQTGENDADVNEDGIVNAEDIILVIAAIEAAAAAPTLHTQARNLFTAEEVQQWLTEARGLADKSPAHRRGIAVLEQLLTLLTPKETALLPNYPNPFNPETWVPYQLAKPADVTLTIYDINGRVVRTLDLGHQSMGIYESRSRAAYWDGKNNVGEPVASGVYFYTLKAGDFSATRKMLVRK